MTLKFRIKQGKQDIRIRFDNFFKIFSPVLIGIFNKVIPLSKVF